MKKLQFVNFFRVVFLLLMFSAFSSSAWAVKVYFDDTPTNWSTVHVYVRNESMWNGDNGVTTNNATYYSMTKIGSTNIWECDITVSFSHICFVKDRQDNYNNLWNTQAAYYSNFDSSKTLLTPKDNNENRNGTKYFNGGSWSTYSGDSGSGGTSTSLPTSKGDCQKIEIYSKDNYNLYVFNNGGHVGYEWGSTQKGESTTYNGSSYYKWTICDKDEVQIIFQNGDRTKQSGDSPVLYGGYVYVFDGQYVSDSRPVPTPDSFDEVDCSTTGTCYNSGGSTGEDDGQDSYLEALQCDASNTRIIFTEDFGTFSDDKGRASYSKSGTGFTAKVPTSSYTAMTTSCTAIKDAGYYAVLANPFYAGCGNQNQGDTHACECNDGQWYQNIQDHTEGDTNGGMLFYNCRDGKSQTDILYESTVDVCQNTFINFSAYIASATASGRGCDVKAKVRFILYDATSNEELSRYTTDYIPLEEGKWEKIAVMFNSKSASKVTLKLLNLAAEGCGNDLLLDDVTFSVCTPKANLVCSNGTEEFTIIPGQKETLTASIISGVMENPYYLWQYQSNKAGWMPIGQPEVNKTELEVIPEANPTLYRVIIANTAEEAINIAAQGNPSACGIYAITNTVTANVTNLGLISNLPDGSICADGVDKNTLTLKVTNPLNVAVTGVKVAVEIPEGVTAYNAGTTTVFTGFAEFNLAANGSKTLTLDLKSKAAIAASQIKSIKSYIAKIFDLTWDSESALVKASSDITVNPVPTAKFAVASENICKGSTTIGTNVIISNGSPNYTLTIGGTNYTATTSPYLFAVNPTSTTTYTLTKVMDAKGCYSTPTSNNTVTVNVEEIKITTHPASTSVCVGAGATFSVVASGVDKYQWQVSSDNSNWNNISGATASTYTISATTANDNNKYYRVVVSKDGGKCAQQESNSAMLTVKTTAVPSLTKAEYKECATSGSVQLSTLFSGTGLKFYSDAALTNEVTTFSASEVVTGKKYYATQTINGCTSAATEISVTVLELPKLTLATTDKNAICGTENNSKATLTYKFEGGKAPYILSVQRTEDGGVTETITPSNLSATGTYTLQPTTKTTYKFTQVKDANGCVSASASGLVDDVVIDVKRLSITSNLNDESVCADKKITYTIGAEGDDIKYQWFQSTDNGASFNKVGTNSSTYTPGNFAIGDKKQYKVVVSQHPEVCSSITSAVCKVTVNDCSSFELAYTSVKNVVCKEDQIELKLTLSNNSDIDATDVIVNISNISNQYFVSSSSTTYNHVAGTWTIASLRKGDSVTLTIILKGTTVVKDVVSVAYISKSGSTTYTETTTQAKDTENITVKGITAKPSVTNYAACPEVGMLNLVDQVTSDKTNLVFYTTETGFASKTQSSKNAEGITQYWVTNTKTGECESERTKLDIQVYPQPTATISGTTTICKGESTNLTIALTGTEKYNIVLSSGDGKSQVTGSSTTIAVSPTETTPYTLTKVEDGNGCPATLSGSAKVTVNDKPVITLSRVDLDDFCPGDVLTLPANVEVEDNGATITSQGWLLNGVSTTSAIELNASHNNAVIEYTATNECGAATAVEYATIVVKEISENVRVNNYISCPNDNAEFPITNLVTSNKDGLKVMGKNDAGEYYDLTSVPMVNPSVQTTSTTYYITNTENGKCESTTPTPVTVEVYKPVTASISAPVEVCYGNNSAVEISLDGEAPYNVVYNNGTANVPLNRVTASSVSINDALYTTTTYSLVSVTDDNGCEATITTDDQATITVNELPTIASVEIEDDDDYICQGTTTNLIVTFTGNAQFTFTINGTQYKSDDNEFEMEISQAGRYVVENLVDAKCSSAADSQTSATLYVETIPVITVSPTSAELDCNTEEITLTASGAHSYSWTDNKNSAPTSGDKLVAKRTDTGTTIYTVVGTSQHGCASDEVSVTVKENFVAPTVELKPQLQPNGEPWPTELTCRMKRIPVVADTENSSVDIVKYEWSNGLSTTEYTELSTKGKHTVTVTGKNGCTATSSIEITENVVNPILSVEHIGSRSKKETTVLNCFNQYNYVTPSVSNVSEIGGSIEYFWYKNGREYFYGDYLEISEAGTYMILANGANDCEATYTLVLTEDKERPEAEIVASEETVTCSTPEVELTVKTDVDCNYFWTGVGGEEAEKQTIKVNKGDTYQVFVQSNANGCITTLDYTLDEKTDLPVVEITPSEEKVTCKPNTLTASGAKTYTWSTEEAKDAIEVTAGGTYKVYGTNEYGCVGETEITLEEDKLAPSIKLTSDTTTVTCRKQTVVLTAEVTNAEDARTYSYTWAQNNVVSNVTKSTFDAKVEATYKVTITDETNACKADETINIKENKQNPLIDIKPLAAVCLPATVDLKTAVGPLTKADEVKYYADAALTQEVTDTNIDAAENAIYYVVGYEIDNNGCVGDAYSIPVNIKPTTSKPVVENYNECAKEGTVKLSSLVKSDASKLTFYEDATSDAPIADVFNASEANTITSYWVSNTQLNSCESERAEIQVEIAGFIDFTIDTPETRVPAGEEITITVTPLTETPVEQYVWYRGDEYALSTEELELSEQIYLSTKYSVQAIGRCNSPKQEVYIEAIWPTAFTPHNNNGKNEVFAEGMKLIIFNRFYTKIFEGNDGWDGTINGAMNDSRTIAVPGVYYYSVQLPNGQVKKGTIEIVKVD